MTLTSAEDRGTAGGPGARGSTLGFPARRRRDRARACGQQPCQRYLRREPGSRYRGLPTGAVRAAPGAFGYAAPGLRGDLGPHPQGGSPCWCWGYWVGRCWLRAGPLTFPTAWPGILYPRLAWARGAVGSASEWHSEGRGFDSPRVHHFFEFNSYSMTIMFSTFIRPYDTLLALYRAQESALILGLVRPGQEDLTKPLGGRNKCTILRLGRAADPGPSGPSLGACYWPLNTW